MWQIILTISTALSYSLYISVKVGQFIVTLLRLIMTNGAFCFNKLYLLLAIILEDFTLFLQDLVQRIYCLIGTITYSGECMVGAIAAAFEVIKSFQEFVALLSSSIVTHNVNTLLTVTSGLKNIAMFTKQLLILLGDGMWFIVILIPSSILSLGPLLLYYLCNLCSQMYHKICEYIQKACDIIVESVIDCYQFVIDISMESVIGLVTFCCMLYIFFQFSAILLTYVKDKINLLMLAFQVRYNDLKRATNRVISHSIMYIRSVQVFKNRSITTSDNKDQTCDGRLCIVCQDNFKSILIMPCRHLCLCSTCSGRVIRYNGRCPVCRRDIQHTMKIYT